MKLAAIVILYYPDNNVINNILSYLPMVDSLIIWDNTPYNERKNYTIKISTDADKIIYLGTKKNEGIAYALNRSINWCLENEYTHLLTMDQDSNFENFQYYINYIHTNLLDTNNIFVPNLYFTDKKTYQYNTKKEIISVSSFITSGSIYKLSLFTSIGGFREDYFIDAIDDEFFFRAQKSGYPITCITKAILNHQLGYNTKTCFGFYTNNYSAFRSYYLIRNHIWLKREYKSYSISRFIYVNLLKRFFGIIVSEKNKCSKLSALLKGTKDGLFGNIKNKGI